MTEPSDAEVRVFATDDASRRRHQHWFVDFEATVTQGERARPSVREPLVLRCERENAELASLGSAPNSGARTEPAAVGRSCASRRVGERRAREKRARFCHG
jgi:hypothetical protein